jgi:hypothetical protein
VNASLPLNGPFEVLPPATDPEPRIVASSLRTWVCTVPPNAVLVPVTVTGEAIDTFQTGAVSLMASVAAPSTH